MQFFSQLGAVLQYPQIEIGFRPIGEFSQYALPPGDLHQRQVDSVIPMSDRLLVRDIPLLINAHKVAMDLNVLFQFAVLSGDTHAQIGLRAEAVQFGALQEASILGLDDQVIWPDIGREGHLGLNLDDMGLDVGRAKLPGNGYPVVTVQHEIGLADLINLNGRQASQIHHRQLDTRPSPFILVCTRQKATRKVVIAPNATDDGINRDVLQATRYFAGRSQFLPHLFVRQESSRLASYKSQDLLQLGAEPRTLEILFCLRKTRELGSDHAPTPARVWDGRMDQT